MRINIVMAFCLSFVFSYSARAAFDENARRYLSAQELVLSLDMFFPLTIETVPTVCKKIDVANSALSGVSSPSTGNPIAPGPTQATVQWITNCVSAATEGFKGNVGLSQQKLKDLVGLRAYNEMSTPSIALGLSRPWNTLDKTSQEQAIASSVEVLLGSDDVIRDFGLIDPTVLRGKLTSWIDRQPNLTVFEVIRFLSVNLALRDEFLSY